MKPNLLAIVVFAFLTSCGQTKDVYHGMSASMYRYKTQWENKEPRENEFYTSFKYYPVNGLGYEEGISRRDPSTIIKVNGKYYVYYTRSQKCQKPVGYKRATETVPAHTWDLADIYYATSDDGINWTEQGVAAKRGPKGEFDDRSIHTPDILYFKGKYYLYYQAVKGPYRDRTRNVIGMSWADSPEGPWHRHPVPVLEPGEPGVWDGDVDNRSLIKEYGAHDCLKVHDPTLIVRDGKLWMYYKTVPMGVRGPIKKPYPDLTMSLAIAENPAGPFVKHPLNPVSASGHEAVVWPYKEGVATLISANGPEKNTIQWAKDGVNFEVKAHIVLPPDAAGLYCPDKFTDTKDGQGFTWGLSHVEKSKDKPWTFIIGFKCNLTQGPRDLQFKKENIRFDERTRLTAK